MISLEKSQYHKVADSLRQVTINNFFARSVIEKKVNGSVYVDNVKEPKTFYIVHPYGMSLLFGENDNREFNAAFHDYALNISKKREKHEWMQAFPGSWDATLKNLFRERLVKSDENSKTNHIVEFNTRLNFKFNADKYLNLKRSKSGSDLKIIRTNKEIFEEMKGSVVPFYFWENADDFYKNGIGFSAFYEDKLVSTAYSAFIHDNFLELGIETVEGYRGKGIAWFTCAALIDFCLENNFEPIWACRLENTGSVKLAQKLGFEISARIPYYRLSN